MTRRHLLTKEQVQEMRALRKRGHTYAKLAILFGVGESTIRDHLKYWVGYSV